KRCVIGSYHFVFEDEGVVIAEADKQKFDSIPEEYSPLYLAVDGRLKAVICIFDPLREDAADIVRQLHKMRISKICMMTGDNKKTAEAVARKLDLDEYHAEVLPEDKRNFVAEDQAMGRTVIMVGDGINDTPALSEADAGIAISDGAAIAREIADITLSGNNLEQLVITRKLSEALMSRIHKNYCLIMGINGTLIALGVMGILTPAVSSLLHNTSTMAIGIGSMRNLLPDQ
ncbi:MAG: HAD-IC family P-type ATPase, partial [Oribacterium sp.]|nr:HAD-IC family P-type ATPase [Oribacterium sp.]